MRILSKHILEKIDNTDPSVNEALIFIADISGFTKFVRNTDPLVGQSITSQLLSTIIDSNALGLKVVEIEGDAILFCKFGKPPELSLILSQYQSMLVSFKKKLQEINTALNTNFDLSLKLITHYGSLIEYSLNGFIKFYGEALIVAHRLLKNSLESRNYVLITDELLAVVKHENHDKPLPNWVSEGKLYLPYDNYDRICTSYFKYDTETLKINSLRNKGISP